MKYKDKVRIKTGFYEWCEWELARDFWDDEYLVLMTDFSSASVHIDNLELIS
jgi:hypothetical protein